MAAATNRSSSRVREHHERRAGERDQRLEHSDRIDDRGDADQPENDRPQCDRKRALGRGAHDTAEAGDPLIHRLPGRPAGQRHDHPDGADDRRHSTRAVAP